MNSRIARSLPAALALAGMLTLPGWAPRPAEAQVAVPTIIPVSPSLNGSPAGFVTPNPAAMQWGAPSRIGLGAGNGEIKPDAGETTEYRATFGGARLVGQRLSIAGEAVSLRDRSGPRDFAIDTGAGAVAARPMSPLVIGVGYANQDDRQGLIESTQTSLSGGASYRLGEWLYVGGALGQDKLAIKDKTDPLQTYRFDGDRPFWLAGAGIRYGGRVRIHPEYYMVDRDPFEENGTKFSEVKAQAGVAEIGLGPLALGFRAAHNEERSIGSHIKTDAQVYDVAWAPMLGLAIGVRFESAVEQQLHA